MKEILHYSLKVCMARNKGIATTLLYKQLLLFQVFNYCPRENTCDRPRSPMEVHRHYTTSSIDSLVLLSTRSRARDLPSSNEEIWQLQDIY